MSEARPATKLLRTLVGATGVALPFGLWGGQCWQDGRSAPRASISDYWYFPQKTYLVRSLRTTGTGLVFYRLARVRWDNALSIGAGAALWGVSTWPTGLTSTDVPAPTPCQAQPEDRGKSLVHYASGLGFFSLAALLSLIYAAETDGRDRVLHAGCTGVMFTGTAVYLAHLTTGWGPAYSVFLGESIGLIAFGVSWGRHGVDVRGILPRAGRRTPRSS